MNMPADEICPRKPAPKIPKYITLENLATVVLIGLLSLVFMYVVTYAYDWPNADDFDSVRLYEKWFTHGHYEVLKVLQEHNQMHPLGFLYLMTFIVFKLFGVHPVAVIWLNSAIIFTAGTILSVYSRTLFNHKIIKAILPALIFAFSFHPIQAGHLIWAFEVGWFFINAAAVCNVVLVERFGGRAIGLVLLLLVFASMSSAHGCVLWLSAALHVSLIPHYRRRLLTIGVLITGFTINVLAIFSFMPQTDVTHKIASIKFGLYCLALLGAEFGVRDEPVLVACGAVVAVACSWVVWRLLRAPKTAALRMAVVLISASAGFLLLFAAGR